MYSTIVGIYLQSPETRIEQEKCFLSQRIQQLGYDVQTKELAHWEDNLVQILHDHLVRFDLVIMITASAQKVFDAAVKVYDEHCDTNSQVIKEDNERQVLWLHRLYILEALSPSDELGNFMEHLRHLKEAPVFRKVFKLGKHEKMQLHIEELLNCNNGLKACKEYEDEVVVSSRNIDELNKVQEYLHSKGILQSSSVIESNSEMIINCNYSFIQDAISHIQVCFNEYQPENVFISFNGGKDCTVLLHLTLLVLKHFYPQFTQPVFCMYVQSQKPFPQVLEFIARMQQFYNLDVRTLKCGIKEGLRIILDEKPQFRACLMGTRRSDPFSAHLRHFHATDNGFPDIMRVSPLLDWEFAHIWDYLINFKVPYCNLYDEGYTSLGNVDDTDKNPQLLQTATAEYYPAYKLLTSANERSGRRK